jgi:hypothetical protein
MKDEDGKIEDGRSEMARRAVIKWTHPFEWHRMRYGKSVSTCCKSAVMGRENRYFLDKR